MIDLFLPYVQPCSEDLISSLWILFMWFSSVNWSIIRQKKLLSFFFKGRNVAKTASQWSTTVLQRCSERHIITPPVHRPLHRIALICGVSNARRHCKKNPIMNTTTLLKQKAFLHHTHTHTHTPPLDLCAGRRWLSVPSPPPCFHSMWWASDGGRNVCCSFLSPQRQAGRHGARSLARCMCGSLYEHRPLQEEENRNSSLTDAGPLRPIPTSVSR